jgi:site-specific DNA recombinase
MDPYRFGGQRICSNTQVRTDLIEEAVWDRVREILEHPSRIEEEYQRRLKPPRRGSTWDTVDRVSAQMKKLRQGVARLIDSYAEGLLEKEEFEPRVKRMKERLAKLEEQARHLADEAAKQRDLRLVVGRLTEFSEQIRGGLATADWMTRREIIRSLVKRVEIGSEQVNVVFRLSPPPFVPGPEKGILQDCWRREQRV